MALTEEERHRLAMRDAEGESLTTLEAGSAILEELKQCPACGGEAELMGVLGTRAHYNCRNCGTWSS